METGFEGTPQQLLDGFDQTAPGIQAPRGDLPRSPEEPGRNLKNLEADLRSAGVLVERYRASDRHRARRIRLSRTGQRTGQLSSGEQWKAAPLIPEPPSA